MPLRSWQQADPAKYQKIVELKQQGFSFRSIAKLMGVNHTRVRQIYIRELIRKDDAKKETKV